MKIYFSKIQISLCLLILCASCNSSDNTKKKGVEVHTSDDGPVNIVRQNEKFETEEGLENNSLGIQEAQSGNFIIAKEYFLEAYKYENNNPTILNNLGLVEKSLGNQNNSANYFEKAIQTDSNYFNSYVNYSLLLFEMKEYEKSVKMAEYVIRNNNDSEFLSGAYLNSALSLVEMKDCSKAKEFYTKFHSLIKDDSRFDNQDLQLKLLTDKCEDPF